MDLDDKLDAFYKDTRIWPLGRDMPAAMCGGRLNIESLQMDAYHYWKKVQAELAEAKKENETIRAELAEAKKALEPFREVARLAAYGKRGRIDVESGGLC